MGRDSRHRNTREGGIATGHKKRLKRRSGIEYGLRHALACG